MDALFRALGNESRRAVVRELHRESGLKHGELIGRVGLDKSQAGQLTKLLDPLEEAGIVRRADGRYYLVDRANVGRLLITAADLHVSAQKSIAERAQAQVSDAERLAEDIRSELG